MLRYVFVGAVALGLFSAISGRHFDMPSTSGNRDISKMSKSEDNPVQAKKNVIGYSTEDVGLNAAKVKARATLPRFFELMAAGTDGNYTLKFPLTQNGRTEHIWMQLADIKGDVFIGILANTPVNGNKYRSGDRMEISRGEIEDWMVQTNTALYGGYTARYAMKDMPKDEAEQFAKMFKD